MKENQSNSETNAELSHVDEVSINQSLLSSRSSTGLSELLDQKSKLKTESARAIVNSTTHQLPRRNTFLISLHIIITCILLSSSFEYSINLWTTQHYFMAIMSLVYTSISLLMFAFALKVLISGVFNMYRPTKSFVDNHQFYGSIPQRVLPPEQWPSTTVQIPVHKESFADVIRPTLESVLKATHGHANVIVQDDGLMVMAQDDLVGTEERISYKKLFPMELTLEEEEIAARLSFYRQHNIGFIARSKKNRAGLFKKGSNLNFGMNLADQLEHRLANSSKESPLQSSDEYYHHELEVLLTEQTLPTAAEGNILFGEYIVLLDKDSYMPEGIIERTLPEFISDHKLAFTQHRTRPINGDENYFANLLGRFTENLYFIWINIATLDGDFPPLVGHNAFLRKSAMQAVKIIKGETSQYWNEKVSEDFDLSMRLQAQGYHGKYIVFPGFDFGEGVSRTFQEEAAKLKKFAFGAMELAFNPLSQMLRHGIFTNEFKGFWLSNTTPWSAKISIMFYLLSYLAMASMYVYLLFEVISAVMGVSFQTTKVPINSFSVMLICLAIFLLTSTLSTFSVRNEMRELSAVGFTAGDTRSEFWRDVRGMLITMLLFNGLLWPVFQGVSLFLLNGRPSFGATNMDKLEDRNIGTIFTTLIQEHFGQIVVAMSILCFFLTAHFQGLWQGSWSWCIGYIITAVLQLSSPFVLSPMFMEKIAHSFRLKIPRNGIFVEHRPFDNLSDLISMPVNNVLSFQPYTLKAILRLTSVFIWVTLELAILGRYINSFSGTCTWPIFCTWIYRLEDHFGFSKVATGPAITTLLCLGLITFFLTKTSQLRDILTKLILLLGWTVVLVVPSLFIGLLGSPQIIALALFWFGIWMLSICTQTGGLLSLILASLSLILAFGTSYLPFFIYFLVPLYVVRASLNQHPTVTRRAFSALLAPFTAMLGTIFSFLF
ncbi:MAG: hypothetical protein JO235_07685 [Chroococcidiopsidaceae cyanobacterium CP_BM_RX_35]|nr:hypothetical protein [Chroococcidiopsidaceae cyanobacterium CP_BM_RX_35]